MASSACSQCVWAPGPWRNGLASELCASCWMAQAVGGGGNVGPGQAASGGAPGNPGAGGHAGGAAGTPALGAGPGAGEGPGLETLDVDALGPLEGWRAWRVYRAVLWLLPLADIPGAWTPEPEAARCWKPLYDDRSLGESPHPAPAPGCHCGYWALRELRPEWLAGAGAIGSTFALFDALLGGRVVLGRVKLWGRVIPYERGWRAEYAKPLSLLSPLGALRPPHLGRIAMAYRCEVEPYPEALEMQLAEFERQWMGGISGQPMTATALQLAQSTPSTMSAATMRQFIRGLNAIYPMTAPTVPPKATRKELLGRLVLPGVCVGVGLGGVVWGAFGDGLLNAVTFYLGALSTGFGISLGVGRRGDWRRERKKAPGTK